MATLRWFTTASLILFLLLPSAPAAAAKDYRAERYDVQLDIEPGGSLLVTERVRFAFGEDTFTYVYRGLRPGRTDGFAVLRVSMDGRPFTAGDAAGEYEIKREDNGRRRIVWHFSPTAGRAHDFELVYRVRGVVRFEAAEDLLEWHALPTSHTYAIDCASVELRWPAGAALLEPPSVDPAGDGPPPTSPVRFSRCGFGKDESWLVRARYAARSIVAAPPDWQRREAQARRHLPLFLGLAGMILLAGAGGFIAFGLNHRAPQPSEADRAVDGPPDALPVPLGAALAKSGAVTWPVALATILDLAGRGVIAIREVEGSMMRSRDFEMSPGRLPSTWLPFERAIFDLVFTDKSGPRTSLKLSQLTKAISTGSRWKAFTSAAEGELARAGVFDEERRRLRTRVTIVGGVVGAVGFAMLIGAVPFIDEYGGAALMLGVSTGLAGIVGAIVGQSMTPLSDAAVRRAAAWEAYGRHLKALPKSANVAATSALFPAALPAAVAFGTAVEWAKALQKAGVDAGPSWLQRLPDGEPGMAPCVAFLAAGQSVGAQAGHGAAGVGGGAAGGGTSGAG